MNLIAFNIKRILLAKNEILEHITNEYNKDEIENEEEDVTELLMKSVPMILITSWRMI